MSPAVGDADPFGTTTDADAYVPRPACEQALGELIRELREGRKLLVLTGPTGIGKTQLLRVLAVRLEAEAEVLVLPYAGLGFDDLCRWSLGLLGEPLARGAQVEPRQALLEAARRRAAEGRMLVLALDDASGLPPAAARLLTRLVSEADGALRVVVVPVDDPRAGRVLAALGRGICEVRLNTPMTEQETAAYIEGRLARQPPPPEIARRFDTGAVGWLHRASGGFPRELHHLAFRIQRGLADPAGDPFARREQWLEVEGDDLPEAAPAETMPTEDEATTAAELLPAVEPRTAVAPVARSEGLAPVALVDDEAPLPSPSEPAPVAVGQAERPAPAARSRSQLGDARRNWIAVAVLAVLPFIAALWLTSREPMEAPPSPAAAAPVLGEAEAPPEPSAFPEQPSAAEPTEPRVEVAEVPVREDEALELVTAAQNAAATAPAPGARPAAASAPSPTSRAALATAASSAADPGVAKAPALEADSSPGLPAALDESPVEPAVQIPVNLNARPWATVWIDGIERGTTPLAGVPLEEGVHHFRLVFPDGHIREAERKVDAQTRHFSFGL